MSENDSNQTDTDAERVEFATTLIARRLYSTQMHEAFKRKFGNVSPTEVDRYVERARLKLRERFQRSRPDAILESLATYESVVRDPNASIMERMKAQGAIDKLLGLYEVANDQQDPDLPDGLIRRPDDNDNTNIMGEER